jgi:cytochrome c oxidase subunit 1
LQFTEWNMISSIGGMMFGASQLILVWIIIKCVRGGAPAGAQVWEGAHGLEWTLSSPPPYHSFGSPPAISEATAHS